MTYNNTIDNLDYEDSGLLVLTFFYMLHNSPFIGVRMPAMVYAGIVFSLFVYLCFLFLRYRNIIIYILPIFSLFILDFFFEKAKGASGSTEFLQLISGALQTFMLPLLAGYAIAKNSIKLALYMLLIFLSVELVTWITSILAENSFHGIIRLNPGDLMRKKQSMYLLKTSLNVGNFNTVYGCAAILPIAILLIKWRKEIFDSKLIPIITLFVITVLMICFIYISQFTTAFTISVLMTCLVFCPKEISPSFFKRSIIICLFALLIMWAVIPALLHTIADTIESPIMAERFKGIAIVLEGGSNTGSMDVDNRKDVYMKAINTISDTSLLGGWTQGGGGHSFILDHIARYGIIGIILLIVYYKSVLALFFSPYQNEPWSYYYIYGVIGITLFYIFNPSGLYPQILFCYPLSAFLINHKLQETLDDTDTNYKCQ